MFCVLIFFKPNFSEDQMSSVMFKSAFEGPRAGKALSENTGTKLAFTDSFRIKLHIVSMVVETVVCPDQCVIVLDVDTVIYENRRSATFTKTTLSMSAINLYEKHSNAAIIDFFVEPDIRRIISPPHLEIIMSSDEIERSVDVKFSFEPLLVIVDPSLISQILTFMLSFSFSTSSQPAAVTYNVSIDVKRIEMLLTNNESNFLSDVVELSRSSSDVFKTQQSQRWKLRLPEHISTKIQSTSGFRVCTSNVIITCTIPVGGDCNLKSVNYRNFQIWLFTSGSSMQSGRPHKFEAELLIVNMKCWSDQSVKITYSDTVTQSPINFSEENEHHAPGIDPPMQVLAKIIRIECGQILIDLWDNEYSFCISLFTKILTGLFGKPNIPRADTAAAEECFKSPFGFQLQADAFKIRLSKMIDALDHEPQTVASYMLETQNMNLSLLSEGGKTNLRLATDDFVLYELFDALIEPTEQEIPFLHRSLFETNSSFLSKESFVCSVLISDEIGLVLDELITNLTISLRFSDITLNYDPHSAWALNIASILGGNTAPSLNSSSQMMRSKCHVYVNISNFMAIYNCPTTKIKMMHTFRNFCITSNMASDSTKIGFKFVLKELSCKLSNTSEEHLILRPCTSTRGTVKSQKTALISFESFLLAYNFKDVYNIDVCEVKLLHNYSNGSMMIETALGFLSLTGCIDSYDALLVSSKL